MGNCGQCAYEHGEIDVLADELLMRNLLAWYWLRDDRPGVDGTEEIIGGRKRVDVDERRMPT